MRKRMLSRRSCCVSWLQRWGSIRQRRWQPAWQTGASAPQAHGSSRWSDWQRPSLESEWGRLGVGLIACRVVACWGCGRG